MNARHWTDRLSAYLEDELDVGEREQADAHLAECLACREALDDLREVVAAARNLPDRPLDGARMDELWAGISAGMDEADTGVIDLSRRMDSERSPRTVRMTLPQLAAAGIALAMFSGAVSWSAAGVRSADAPGAVTAPTAGVVQASDQGEIGRQYQAELQELEALLDEHRAELQPGTVRILEKNLGIIDRAIDEARAALDADPANAFLRTHVDRAYRRKVDYLRETSQIAGWAL